MSYYYIDGDNLFKYLKNFIEDNEFDFDVIGEQARSIFTTICIINNIDVDTDICDYIIRSLYAILNEKDIGYSYELFEGFMIRHIV